MSKNKFTNLTVMATLFAALSLTQAFELWWLPYSSSIIESAETVGSGTPPSGGFFRLGSITWDLREFEADASLAVYREVFATYSRGTRGLDAVVNISDEFARRFPHGSPKDEFFLADYDPIHTLYAHLGGEGGHCVTRAGLVATTLLASGIPARVLQVLPPDLSGHNIVEIWDDSEGWVLFDPTTGYAFRRRGRDEKSGSYLSGEEAASSPGPVEIVPLGKVPANVGDPRAFISPRFFAGTLVYPEPWLYTRVGERYSHWPFGGRFVKLGAGGWQTGPLQDLLRTGIVVCLLGSAAALGTKTFRLTRDMRVSRAVPARLAVGHDGGEPPQVDGAAGRDGGGPPRVDGAVQHRFQSA